MGAQANLRYRRSHITQITGFSHDAAQIGNTCIRLDCRNLSSIILVLFMKEEL